MKQVAKMSSEIRGSMVLWTRKSVIHGYPLKSRWVAFCEVEVVTLLFLGISFYPYTAHEIYSNIKVHLNSISESNCFMVFCATHYNTFNVCHGLVLFKMHMVILLLSFRYCVMCFRETLPTTNDFLHDWLNANILYMGSLFSFKFSRPEVLISFYGCRNL